MRSKKYEVRSQKRKERHRPLLFSDFLLLTSDFSSRSASRVPRSAFTLIELLLALALSTLLAAVIGQVAVQAARSEAWASKRADRIRRQDLMLETLAADLYGRAALPASMRQLTLSLSEPQNLVLTTLAADPNPTANLHQARIPGEIIYQLRRDPDSKSWSLVRRIRDLTDPGRKPVVETIAAGLARCDWEVFDGVSWQRSYPPVIKQPRNPLLLRMSCQWPDHQVTRTYSLADGLLPFRSTQP